MPDKKKISAGKRRHQDDLRLKGLKVGSVYEAKLVKLRRAEVKRVLELARQFDDEEAIVVCLNGITERDYLPTWFEGLYKNAGMPMASSTARDLKVSKAGGFAESDAWLTALSDYAMKRAAQNIVSMTGSLKDAVVGLTRRLMMEDLGLGVEKLTKRIYREYQQTIEKWQCRRIAQTETMISLGEAAALAADTLDVEFTKQWCTSGLENVRETHEAMDGVIVDQEELFILPGGSMRYPHDNLYRPDPSEIINCACACIREPK